MDPTNIDRADWAVKGLCAFGDEVGQDLAVEPGELISDFLADLMHLCHIRDLDFDGLLITALSHFGEELREEGA